MTCYYNATSVETFQGVVLITEWYKINLPSNHGEAEV